MPTLEAPGEVRVAFEGKRLRGEATWTVTLCEPLQERPPTTWQGQPGVVEVGVSGKSARVPYVFDVPRGWTFREPDGRFAVSTFTSPDGRTTLSLDTHWASNNASDLATISASIDDYLITEGKETLRAGPIDAHTVAGVWKVGDVFHTKVIRRPPETAMELFCDVMTDEVGQAAIGEQVLSACANATLSRTPFTWQGAPATVSIASAAFGEEARDGEVRFSAPSGWPSHIDEHGSWPGSMVWVGPDGFTQVTLGWLAPPDGPPAASWSPTACSSPPCPRAWARPPTPRPPATSRSIGVGPRAASASPSPTS
jgi:hypothetical protein